MKRQRPISAATSAPDRQPSALTCGEGEASTAARITPSPATSSGMSRPSQARSSVAMPFSAASRPTKRTCGAVPAGSSGSPGSATKLGLATTFSAGKPAARKRERANSVSAMKRSTRRCQVPAARCDAIMCASGKDAIAEPR